MANSPTAPRSPAYYRVILTKPNYVPIRCSILSIRRGVYKRVYNARCPRQNGRYDVEPRVSNCVISYVHDHQRQEAGEEAHKYCEHERSEAGVFFLFFGCLAAEFAAKLKN